MYLPKHFEETRIDVVHRLIRDEPFAMLVTLGSGGLNANHLPLELDPEPGPFGTLRGHVARGNRMWEDVVPDVEALAVFQGSQTYITPSWYPTKQETGKVTPTWNYVVVHAYGTPRFYDDPERLRDHVQRLTNRHESARPVPWRVTDAPDDYVTALLRGIVGFEITITRLLGKWKVSQNRTEAERQGVTAGLRERADPGSAAMADLVDRLKQ
jgi:transcriptional regulator